MLLQQATKRGLLVRNSVLNLLGQVLPLVVGVITIPYIVTRLGTDRFGILSIAWMVLGYFSVFDLGLSRATVKLVAEHLSPDRISRVPELVWTSFTLLFGLGVAGAGLMAALVPIAVTRFLKMPPEIVGEARTALLILCAAMPVLLTNDALRGVLEATQRFDLVNLVKAPASILFYLIAVLVIPLGVGVSGIVLLLVLIRLSSTLAYFAFCIQVLPGLKSHLSISRTAMRRLATFGGWVMVTNVVSPLFGYLERILIASVLSVGALAFYSAPYDLVSKTLIFPASIVPSLFPYFSYHGSRSRSEVCEVTSRVLKYLLLAMSPVTAIFIVFANDILRLWLGGQFPAQSTVVLQLVAMIFFLNAFAMIPFTSVQALGRPDLKAILDLIVLPLYAVGAWQLMRRFGINGAAMAKLLITVADCILLYVFAWRMKAFSLRSCIAGPLGRATVTTATLFSAVFLIGSMHLRLLYSMLLVGFVCLCYVAMFWATAVDGEDRLTIRDLCDRMFRVLKRPEHFEFLSVEEKVGP